MEGPLYCIVTYLWKCTPDNLIHLKWFSNIIIYFPMSFPFWFFLLVSTPAFIRALQILLFKLSLFHNQLPWVDAIIFFKLKSHNGGCYSIVPLHFFTSAIHPKATQKIFHKFWPCKCSRNTFWNFTLNFTFSTFFIAIWLWKRVPFTKLSQSNACQDDKIV